MSGSSTPERDTHLLEVGKQCSSPSCLLVDFLPFECQHCGDHFCGDHFLPNAHSCAKYDAAKHDRVAPPCPLCNTPVAIPPGQDPNIRMERHINTECSVMTGRKAKSGTPTCARPKCGKVLFAPIRCDSCKQQFCPQHRFPKDHTCAANRASSKQSPANTWANVSNQTSAASAAAVAALKRATATPPSSGRAPAPTKTQSAAPAASSSRSNPFSSTDRHTILITTPSPASASAALNEPNDDSNDPPARRAKAERESKRRAIQERARKGLPVSEEDRAFLAQTEAGAKDDCIVM